MEIIKTFVNNSSKLNVYGTFENPLFMGREIGNILNIINIRVQIRNMNSAWKVVRKSDTPGGTQKMTFLTEPGLYYLMMRSDKSEAKMFQKWICEEVIPSIRKTGTYELQHKCNDRLTFKIETEDDLHTKVISFIKTQYPSSLFVATLGELQDTSTKRIRSYNMGYIKGSPDLIIQNLHKSYSGFAIEFKSPKTGGVLSKEQSKMLKVYKSNNYKTLLSNNYDEIIIQIIDYFRDVRIKCEHCDSRFKSNKTLSNHKKYFHRIL
jgi:prophage antirepressor-like protein